MYESELREQLEKALCHRYGIRSFPDAYRYGLYRFFILNEPSDDPKVHMRFFLKELHIPLLDDSLMYKNERFTFFQYDENSLFNIVNNWMMEEERRQGFVSSIFADMQEELKKIRRQALREARGYKGHPNYQQIIQYYALNRLNNIHHPSLQHPLYIPHLHHNHEELLFSRTIDELLKATVHTANFKRNDTVTITEAEMEAYLKFHLNEIEEGLTFIGQQVPIEDGRIDLLARDRNGCYVIIELKVEEDKKVVWQALYYPKQVSKIYGSEKVRMFVLSPSFSPSLRMVLQDFPHVECFTYTPHVHLGAIQKVQVMPCLKAS